jgi:hypothetical protein
MVIAQIVTIKSERNGPEIKNAGINVIGIIKNTKRYLFVK